MAEQVANVGHWRVDVQEDTLIWSDQVYRIHGVDSDFTPTVADGLEFYYEEDRERVSEMVGKAFEEGEDFSFQARIVRPDGELRHVASVGHAETSPTGEVITVFGVFKDITETVVAQEQLRQSRDEAERAKFWAGRKTAFPAVGRMSPDYYCMDGTIPRRELPRVLKGISDLSQQYGLKVANVFHAGDGNMHPLILFDANREGELETAEALGGTILELCVEAGGSITGEHGVGREKINQMCAQFDSLEITAFHAVKAAFDPEGLLNPGKNIPTLARCAEFGAMHVHNNELPHPELPSF